MALSPVGQRNPIPQGQQARSIPAAAPQGIAAINGAIHSQVAAKKGVWQSFKDWCSKTWGSFVNFFIKCCKKATPTPLPTPTNTVAVPPVQIQQQQPERPADEIPNNRGADQDAPEPEHNNNAARDPQEILRQLAIIDALRRPAPGYPPGIQQELDQFVAIIDARQAVVVAAQRQAYFLQTQADRGRPAPGLQEAIAAFAEARRSVAAAQNDLIEFRRGIDRDIIAQAAQQNNRAEPAQDPAAHQPAPLADQGQARNPEDERPAGDIHNNIDAGRGVQDPAHAGEEPPEILQRLLAIRQPPPGYPPGIQLELAQLEEIIAARREEVTAAERYVAILQAQVARQEPAPQLPQALADLARAERNSAAAQEQLAAFRRNILREQNEQPQQNNHAEPAQDPAAQNQPAPPADQAQAGNQVPPEEQPMNPEEERDLLEHLERVQAFQEMDRQEALQREAAQGAPRQNLAPQPARPLAEQNPAGYNNFEEDVLRVRNQLRAYLAEPRAAGQVPNVGDFWRLHGDLDDFGPLRIRVEQEMAAENPPQAALPQGQPPPLAPAQELAPIAALRNDAAIERERVRIEADNPVPARALEPMVEAIARRDAGHMMARIDARLEELQRAARDVVEDRSGAEEHARNVLRQGHQANQEPVRDAAAIIEAGAAALPAAQIPQVPALRGLNLIEQIVNDEMRADLADLEEQRREYNRAAEAIRAQGNAEVDNIFQRALGDAPNPRARAMLERMQARLGRVPQGEQAPAQPPVAGPARIEG